MSGDTFVEVITVISEWKTHSYNYRLVNLGAGPDRLQIKVNGKWVEESIPYRWAVVTARIKIMGFYSWRRTKPVPKILLPGMKGYMQWQDLLRIVLYPIRLLSGVQCLLVCPIRQPRPISNFKAWRYKRGHY